MIFIRNVSSFEPTLKNWELWILAQPGKTTSDMNLVHIRINTVSSNTEIGFTLTQRNLNLSLLYKLSMKLSPRVTQPVKQLFQWSHFPVRTKKS